jgi:hypothetical protein
MGSLIDIRNRHAGRAGKDATRPTVLDGAATAAAGLLVSIYVSFKLFSGWTSLSVPALLVL